MVASMGTSALTPTAYDRMITWIHYAILNFPIQNIAKLGYCVVEFSTYR